MRPGAVLLALALAAPRAFAQAPSEPPLLVPAPKTSPMPAAGPQPADPYERAHGHAHAHLCDTQRCNAYCGGREGGTPDPDRMRIDLAQCRSYCMKDCK